MKKVGTRVAVTGRGHVTTHGKGKGGVSHIRRNGKRFTVHGSTHLRLSRPRKPGMVSNVLLGP